MRETLLQAVDERRDRRRLVTSGRVFGLESKRRLGRGSEIGSTHGMA
jgi:hypothetical protein